MTWNTGVGRWFEMSIHPQRYLGDHFEPLLLALAPLYRLWPDPRLLLVVQAIAINLAAVPLYCLARNVFRKSAGIKSPRGLALAVAVAYLLNPFVHNALAFEFHLLPFAVPLLLAALASAEQGRRLPAAALFGAVLLVREDAALVVAAAGVASVVLFPALRGRRPWRWAAGILLVSAAWLVAAVAVVSAFSPTGEYKFAGYFGALRGGTGDTLRAILDAPLTLLRRLGQWRNLEMVGGLLMPTAFLPLVAPAALLLALPHALLFATMQADSRQVLILHYGLVFVPALVVATVFALRRLAAIRPDHPLSRRLGWGPSWPLELATLLLLTSSLYGALSVGQTSGLRTPPAEQFSVTAKTAALRAAAADVGEAEGVVAPRRLLAPLANRQRLYPLLYVLRGTQQLSDQPYPTPGTISALVVDQDDLLSKVLLWRNATPEAVPYSEGTRRLARLVAEKSLHPVWSRDGVALLRPGNPDGEAGTMAPLVTVSPNETAGGVMVAHRLRAEADLVARGADRAELTIRWRPERNLRLTYFLTLELRDGTGRTLAAYRLDPGWGVLPSNEWRAGTVVTSRFALTWPRSAAAVAVSLFPEEHGVEQQRLPAGNAGRLAARRLVVPLTTVPPTRSPGL